MVALGTAALQGLPDAVRVPGYDRKGLTPGVVHVGVGNFHRGHMGVYMDDLFAAGEARDWAIVGAGLLPGDDAMRNALTGQDLLSTVVERAPGPSSARVIGSMVEFLQVGPFPLLGRLADPAIRILSMTVTEGGYFLGADGLPDLDHPALAADAASPSVPGTLFGVIVAALRARREAGLPAFTVLSCDNLPGNGRIAEALVTGLAARMDAGLADWIAAHGAFPNSMVDRICPVVGATERTFVRDTFGIEDAAPVICEPFRQWVIEDRFAAGRPPLEQVGVVFVEDVHTHELMKLRLLNASHASVSYGAALMGQTHIHEAMSDPALLGWLRAFMSREMMPTLAPLPGTDYAAYLEMVIARFSNPEIRDTIARNAAQGSDRQPKFILPALREAIGAGAEVPGFALELALWCAYCAEFGASGQLDDAIATRLTASARIAQARPAAFLEIREVFGDLAGNPGLLRHFGAWLDVIARQGVAEALRLYVQRANPAG